MYDKCRLLISKYTMPLQKLYLLNDYIDMEKDLARIALISVNYFPIGLQDASIFYI